MKFKEKPLGRGLGELSSPNAQNKVMVGYRSSQQEVPIYSNMVTDS